MILWFAGLSLVVVWQVFRDPAIDHRLIVAGALLPDGVDAVTGRATVPHSVLFSVTLLVAVMLATRGRRHLRRQLLALPIGTFVHLVLDGAWTATRVFWWPFFGLDFTAGGLPSTSRPLAVIVVMEAGGAAALVWFWRRFGLDDAGRRGRFLRTGRLAPELKG